MARHFRHRSASPRKKRKFEWARTNYSKAVAAGADQVDLLAGFRARLGGITQNLPDWTCVRIRGMINFDAAQNGTIDTGLIVVSAIKWSTTVTGLPTPVALPHEDYMLYQVGPQGVNAFPAGQVGLIFNISFDTKAMRKLNQIDDTIWLVWESANAAATYTAHGVISAGFKLP